MQGLRDIAVFVAGDGAAQRLVPAGAGKRGRAVYAVAGAGLMVRLQAPAGLINGGRSRDVRGFTGLPIIFKDASKRVAYSQFIVDIVVIVAIDMFC